MINQDAIETINGENSRNVTSRESTWFAAMGVLAIFPAITSLIWALILNSTGIDGHDFSATVLFSASAVSIISIVANSYIKSALYVYLISIFSAIVFAFTLEVYFVKWALIPLFVAALYTVPLFNYIKLRVPSSFNGRAKVRPFLAALWVIAAVMTVSQVTRLSVFIVDQEQTHFSLIPGVEWFERHNCLTGYVYAARLASASSENIYDTEIVETDPFTTPLPEYATDMAPFTLDGYLYTPAFLLLPKVLTTISNDFSFLRVLWFSFSVLITALSLSMLISWLQGPIADQLIKLMPIFVGAMPVALTFQLGGSQIVAFFGLLIALVALERRQILLGSFLFSFVLLMKLWPVLLMLPLLFQRRYKEIAYICGFAVLMCLMVFLVFDAKPWLMYFNYILPKISDGSAFVMMDESIVNLASNFSLIGIPFKLVPFGIDAGWQEAKIISLLYSVLLLAITVFVSMRMREGDKAQHICLWLALIVLGTLRSPLAPMHILIGFLLLMVVTSYLIRARWQVGLFAIVWIMMTVLIPPEGVEAAMLLSIFRQMIIFSFIFWVIFRFCRKDKYG
ncbi:glycosyltransferase family 87 protein [Shewanella woodyi]|uniref:glycosyltransferase family 87 protein n=1 Tax=Shewanella woodyi TaxID=60961 RepID=UPI003747A2FD